MPLPSLSVTRADRADRRAGDAAAARRAGPTAAPTCSSGCRAAATTSRRRARRSTTRSGSRSAEVDLDSRRLAPRLSAARRARPALLRERRARPGRPPAAAAPAGGLRPPLRARVRAGRVAAEGALADDRAARPADGEGARGRAARRDRGDRSTRTRAPSPAGASTCRCARPARSCARTPRTAAARCWRSTPPGSRRVHVSSLDGDWLAALAVLAEAEADGARPVVELLARESGPASRAVETVVVTARLAARSRRS